MEKLRTKCVVNKDYDLLKKTYGEQFARFCRSNFATILNKPGALTQIMTKYFAPTHSLADDLKDKNFCSAFQNFVFNLFHHKKNKFVDTRKSPEELMSAVGYTLYPECQTEADIQAFKKYYRPNEVLCTFNGGRLRECRVWFAVKNNVDDIKRPEKPDRQDKYGTSVISIQFKKDEFQKLSIKNRYNHHVEYADATFDNLLEKIVPGLTIAFRDYYQCYDCDSETKAEISGYIQSNDGKYYRENFEINGSNHFCENNVVVCDGLVKTFDSHSQILAENYLFDFQQNRVDNIYLHHGNNDLYLYRQHDAFTQSLGNIDKMQVVNEANRVRKILVYSEHNPEPKIVWLNQHNEITGYQNREVGYLNDCFMMHNRKLNFLDLPNVKSIDEFFLIRNRELKVMSLPNLRECHNCFLIENTGLHYFNAPKLTKVGAYFLLNNQCLKPENLVTGKIRTVNKLMTVDECFNNNPFCETFRARLFPGYLPAEREIFD